MRAENAVLGGHRAKQSCWQTPRPCSKHPPPGPVVFGGAKQGNGTSKLGNQRLDEAGGFIVRVQASHAWGLIFTTSGSQRSAGLVWPFLCCCTTQMVATHKLVQLLHCAIAQTMPGNGTFLLCCDSTAVVSSCLTRVKAW